MESRQAVTTSIEPLSKRAAEMGNDHANVDRSVQYEAITASAIYMEAPTNILSVVLHVVFLVDFFSKE
jgi:hypothetical protein